jgi:hypothetical protein
MLALLLAAELSVPSYAQHLAAEVVAKTPGLLVIAMHVSPPGMANYPIVASNIGRIGKPADDDDMRVINTGKTNLEVAHGGTRFEVELAMRDVTGETVGASGLVFPYQPGESKAALEKKAIAIRDRLAARTLNAASLVEPYPFEPMATTKTHAQKLVDETLAKHAELIVASMHVTPPKTRENRIIASNFGRIGKKSDDDDLNVIGSGKAKAGVYGEGKRYGVELPLQDEKGTTVGALSLGWPYRNEDAGTFLARAEKIRDELRQRIPSIEKLVELDP